MFPHAKAGVLAPKPPGDTKNLLLLESSVRCLNLVKAGARNHKSRAEKVHDPGGPLVCSSVSVVDEIETSLW